MVTESKPDVRMILCAMNKAKAVMSEDERLQYEGMLDKNIPKFERYLEKIDGGKA